MWLQHQMLTKVQVMQWCSAAVLNSTLPNRLSPPVNVSKPLGICNTAGSILAPPCVTPLVLTTNTHANNFTKLHNYDYYKWHLLNTHFTMQTKQKHYKNNLTKWHNYHRLQGSAYCCKSDQPYQWEMPKFEPPYIPNPLIFQHQNWHRWLVSAIPLATQNLVKTGSQGASLWIRETKTDDRKQF